MDPNMAIYRFCQNIKRVVKIIWKNDFHKEGLYKQNKTKILR